jgi:hypothetical protein
MRLQATRTSVTSAGGAGDALYRAAGGRPTLDQRFAKDKALVDKVSGNNLITFSRASSGTYVDSDGLIKTSPVNLISYSEQFDQWTAASNSVITPNSIAAPDGTLTADLVYFSQTGFTNISQSITLTQGKNYTISVYAKAVTPGTNNKFTFYIASPQFKTPANSFETTSEWQKFTFTFTHDNPSASTLVYILNKGDTYITNVYFWGAQLEEGTTATDYIPTGGTISGAPRFDHDPVTGESLGLLIESSSINKIRDSEDFDVITTGWTATSSGATSLSGVLSPDGVTFMTLMDLSAVAGSVSSGSRVYQNNSVFQAVDQAFSFYARSVSGTGTFPVGYYSGSTYIKSYVELTETIKRYTMIVPASVNGGNIVGWTRRGDTQLETLDQALVWGAQFEDSAYPTSYIPTSGSTVTRSPDLCTIEGTNFSSWYNQSEGTVFVEAKNYPHPVSGKALVALAFSDNTYNNRITLASSTGNDQFNFDVTVGGSQQRAILGNFVSSGLKSSGGYKSTGSAGSLDGAAAVTSNTPNIPSVISQLDIGQTHNGSNFLNGHISRLAYFPPRLPDATQQNITS